MKKPKNKCNCGKWEPVYKTSWKHFWITFSSIFLFMFVVSWFSINWDIKIQAIGIGFLFGNLFGLIYHINDKQYIADYKWVKK